MLQKSKNKTINNKMYPLGNDSSLEKTSSTTIEEPVTVQTEQRAYGLVRDRSPLWTTLTRAQTITELES